MARINERLLCQMLDDTDEVVLLDEFSGAEIVVPLADVSNLVVALSYFATSAVEPPAVKVTPSPTMAAILRGCRPVVP
jgi:hypothetical protein